MKAMITIEEIIALPEAAYNDSWVPAINAFQKRYNERYFDQIEILQKHPKTKLTCGFIVTSIDCVLIETLEQFYEGLDEIKTTNASYYRFFERAPELKGVFADEKDAGKFFGLVRSGLLHQAKTKQRSIINVKKSTPIIRWVDEANKNLGFEIHRNLFHACVVNQYSSYIDNLCEPANTQLRVNFKAKMLTIL